MLLDLLTHAHTAASTVAAGGAQPVHLLADGQLPNIGPDHNAPGAQAFQSIVGALMFYGLLGGLAGLILSSLAFGLGRWFSNHHATTGGRIGMLSSMAATIIIGGGSTLINWAFNLGGSIHA